jgi:hypothetical protein
MSDHPSTFKGESLNSGATAWDDHAELHKSDDGGGVLDSAKMLKSGTFAELIKHLMLLPVDQRSHYVIHKAGDRAYTAVEAIELAGREDFPA